MASDVIVAIRRCVSALSTAMQLTSCFTLPAMVVRSGYISNVPHSNGPSNSLGMAFLKYGSNRLFWSYGCFGLSIFDLVSLAGMLALDKSNLAWDLDLNPGRSCSVKTKVLLTFSSLTSRIYSLGIG